jgi:RNA polymerase primary sigma factor
MPPLAKCRIPEIADLADQLRFAPHEALLRQVESAESLAGDLDEHEKYPVDWLVFRITGHRPDGASGESAVFSGAAVLADLSAFVERLCEAAEFGLGDLPEGSVDADTLAGHWNVSRKTIDRSRRKGLIARRVRNERGRASLYFSPASVSAYEGRRGEAIEKAGSFSRLDGATEARILRRAARYRRVFNCTLNQAAVRLAEKFGRSHQGIRELLERHDARARERGGEAIFEERPDRSARTQIVALRMSRSGAEPSEIARAIFGPRADKRRATRLIRQARARLLRRLSLDGPVSPAFSRPDADEVLLAPASVRTALGGGPGADDLEGFVRVIRESSPMPAADEAARAVAHQYLRFRARRALERLSETDPNPTRLDEIETRLRWAALLRNELVRSELAVLGTTIERQVGRSLDRVPPAPAAPAAGHRAARDGRGGGPVRPVPRRAARGARVDAAGQGDHPGDRRRNERVPRGARRPATPSGMPDFTRLWPGVAWVGVARAAAGAARRVPHLSGRDRLIIGRRSGFDGAAPETITGLAERLETTRMHAARYERAAVREALRVHRRLASAS